MTTVFLPDELLMKTPRILHVDADNYFASCEEILSPALRGRPLIVAGGRRQDGIVLSASRRAKEFGIKSGMACFRARRCAPSWSFAPRGQTLTGKFRRGCSRVLNHFSPLVVPVSIDEGFLDLSAEADGAARWRELSATISREVGLPLSGGLANSRWLAKLATDAGEAWLSGG